MAAANVLQAYQRVQFTEDEYLMNQATGSEGMAYSQLPSGYAVVDPHLSHTDSQLLSDGASDLQYHLASWADEFASGRKGPNITFAAFVAARAAREEEKAKADIGTVSARSPSSSGLQSSSDGEPQAIVSLETMKSGPNDVQIVSGGDRGGDGRTCPRCHNVGGTILTHQSTPRSTLPFCTKCANVS